VWLRHRRNEQNDSTRRVRIATLPGQACSYEFVAQCRVRGQTGSSARAHANTWKRSPTSHESRVEFDGSFKAGLTSPVSYMLP
jgi:hypothetical protein